MECPNCEEETDRLIEPALLRLPVDLSEYSEGDEVRFKEPGGFFTEPHVVVEREGEKLTYVWDAHTEPLCVGCFTHGVWPSLFPYIANKPPQVVLDGWREPVWKEGEQIE